MSASTEGGDVGGGDLKSREKAALERDLGEQPIARLLAKLGIEASDLVAASREQLTHKMVRRACKGRRLTPNVQAKLLNALNAHTAGSYGLADLFDYGARSRTDAD